MLYSECSVTHLSTNYRERTLPARGKILCPIGDHVTADSVVAETDLSAGYRLLDLVELLGVQISNVSKAMVKNVGDTVEEGETIARTKGLAKKECVSPVQGKILDARGSKVLIEVTPQHIELRAFYPGKIVNLIPGRGVVIEVTGALIQGVWGTGQEVLGRLEAVVSDGNAILTAEMITGAHMGTILIGGRTFAPQAVEQAVRNQVRALIVGSIPSDLSPTIESSSLSLIITEGFGDFAMNPDAFDLLHSYSGREACFSPATQTRWKARRPEIVVPLPAERQPPAAEHGASIQVGTRVRALRAPYENVLGRILSLPQHRYRLESGIRTRGAEVDLDSVGKVFIPLENLEIVL